HLPEVISCRHKAHIDPCEKQNKSGIGIDHTYPDSYQHPFLHSSENNLKQNKENNNGQKGYRHLSHTLRKFHGKHLPELDRILDIRNTFGSIPGTVRTIDQT